MVAKTRQLSQEPDEKLLSELRVLERKMGLVLTLVRAAENLSVREQNTERNDFSSKLLYGALSMNSLLQTCRYRLIIQQI